MNEFNYSMLVSVDPPKCKRGQKVTITIKISNLTGTVSSVILSIPKYGIKQKIPQVSSDTFYLRKTLPSIVPKGIYQGNVYAIDSKGNKGPAYEMSYEVY